MPRLEPVGRALQRTFVDDTEVRLVGDRPGELSDLGVDEQFREQLPVPVPVDVEPDLCRRSGTVPGHMFYSSPSPSPVDWSAGLAMPVRSPW